MLRSETIDKLMPALIKAKSEFKPLISNKKGNFGSYVDLLGILNSIKDSFTKNGLFFSQQFDDNNPEFCSLKTAIIHETGEWIGSFCLFKLPIPIQGQKYKDDNQEKGKAITYHKRYAALALLGITDGSEEDFDDPINANSKYISDDQYDTLQFLLKKDEEYAKTILNHFKLERLDDIPKDKYLLVLQNILNQKKILNKE